jgi:hypothetical protein
MKATRITISLAFILTAPVAAFAQRKVNTMHRSQSALGVPNPAMSTIPQLAGKWDILSTDASGDQYNSSAGTYLGPIELTADFTQSGTTLTEVAGRTFTSSACSADGTATVAATIVPLGSSGNANVQFTATVDQGYSYVFEGNFNKNTPAQISGTWSTSGGACGVQSGQFTAFQYNQLTNNSYIGQFTSDVYGTLVNGVTVNIKEANDFTVSGTIIDPVNSCFVALTIDPTQSFTSGGLVEFWATNLEGAQVAFIGSNTNSNFQQLPNDQPYETSLYITYFVYQGGGGCQAGDSGHDGVFELINSKPIRLPIHFHGRR